MKKKTIKTFDSKKVFHRDCTEDQKEFFAELIEECFSNGTATIETTLDTTTNKILFKIIREVCDDQIH